VLDTCLIFKSNFIFPTVDHVIEKILRVVFPVHMMWRNDEKKTVEKRERETKAFPSKLSSIDRLENRTLLYFNAFSI